MLFFSLHKNVQIDIQHSKFNFIIIITYETGGPPPGHI